MALQNQPYAMNNLELFLQFKYICMQIMWYNYSHIAVWFVLIFFF